MRPYLLVAALALTGAAATPASAAGCVATADTPYSAGANVHGSGSYTCVTPAWRMEVTVCLESLQPGDLGWQTETCSKAVASDTASVSDDVWLCYLDGFALIRTRVEGWSGNGESGGAISAPTFAPGAGSCGP